MSSLRKSIFFSILLNLIVPLYAFSVTLNIDPIGQVEGEFDVTGTVQFKETSKETKGAIHIFLGGSMYAAVYKVFYTNSGSWSYKNMPESTTNYKRILDAGQYSDGLHSQYIKVIARDYASDGERKETYAPFLINNIPELILDPIGTVEGKFDITGTATFKEVVHPDLNEGSINIFIDNDGYSTAGRGYKQTSVNWSYNEMPSNGSGGIPRVLDSSLFSEGNHEVKIVASAYNGSKTTLHTTFIVKRCDAPGEETSAQAEIKCEPRGGLVYFDMEKCLGICGGSNAGPPRCQN